jgi:hypothetical protein
VAEPAEILFAEALLDLPAEALGQLCVVAELRVAVERQMVGEEVDAGLDEGRDPGVGMPGELSRRAVPEDSVVHQDGVGAGVARALEELDAGGDAGGDLADRPASLDLEPVRAEVLAGAGLQQPVEMPGQFSNRQLSVRHEGLGPCRKKTGRIVSDPARF